ncbi:MAG: thiamine-phosphate pyrophosphorylase [Myxococcota bacterium]|jgi:thiamine-phosphate pyrophosphorylase
MSTPSLPGEFQQRPALPPLILVTDRSVVCGADLVGTLTRVLEWIPDASAMVILREPDLPPRGLIALAERVVALCRRTSTRLLIHERFDVARAVGADGVHLTERSFEARHVRRAWPSGILAVTCRRSGAAASALHFADVALMGPIYPTSFGESRDGWPVGPEILERTRAAAAPGTLIYAMGGIDGETAQWAFDAGADGIAVRSAVLADLDPVSAASLMVRKSGGNSSDPSHLDSPLTIDDHR